MIRYSCREALTRLPAAKKKFDLMKRLGFAACVALSLVASCQKVNEETPLTEIDDTVEAPVQLGMAAPHIDIVSKSEGPIDSWTTQKINLIGFDTRFTYSDIRGYLIDNVAVAAPTGDEDAPFPLRPEGDPYAGKPYFYSENTRYEFYGYYVDDAATSEIVKTETGISIPLKINGAQDIIAAKAVPQTDIDRSEHPNKSQVSIGDVYSSFAARRGVHPSLNFQHLLTRFQFFIVDGNDGRTDDYTKVKITKITMDSWENTTLEIAPEPKLITDKTADRTHLSLAGLEDGISPATGYISPKEGEHNGAKTEHSLMLIPGESAADGTHEIIVGMKFADDDPNNPPIEDMKFTLNAKQIITTEGRVNPGYFEPGKQYNIVLKVYGPEEIKIDSILEKWDDVGGTTIDPDEM